MKSDREGPVLAIKSARASPPYCEACELKSGDGPGGDTVGARAVDLAEAVLDDDEGEDLSGMRSGTRMRRRGQVGSV